MNNDAGATPSASGDTFPCQQCGAALHWDATRRAMVCPYCGFQQAMPLQPAGGMVREIPIEEGYSRATRGLGVPVTTIECKECGATVNVGEGERTTSCAFCGSQAVLPRETDANAIRPESLVAFQVDKKQAADRFGKWLAGLWFRPNNLKKLARVEEMGGVYVPFWTFDAHIESDWSAEAGYYYYETEEYTTVENGETVTRTRQVQRVRWEPAWGRRADDYDDVLVCASKGLPAKLVAKFSTFDTKLLVPYAPQYLSGWRCEAYAIDLNDAHVHARSSMEQSQQSRCSRDVPGDTQRNLSVSNRFSHETFKHVLLPIWIAAYRYNKKVYRFLVNGQTGEVTGEAPYSWWKIALTIAFVLLVIGAIYYFTSDQRPTTSHPSDDTEEPAPKPKKKKHRTEQGIYFRAQESCLG